jgi:hypothetical protein
MWYCVQPPNFEKVGCSLQGVLAQARPKLVMNSFGKKIFMLSSCLAFFPFRFVGGGGGEKEDFLSYFYVLFKFPICSQYVPQSLNVFPNMFSIACHLYPICFGKCCPPFIYLGGPKGRNSTLQKRTFYIGKSTWLHFFLVICQSKLAHCKRKNWTWEALHLINRTAE